MPTLAQLLAANQAGSSGLLAAALRKGMVDPSQLVQPGMYDPNLDFQGQNQALGFFQQFGTDPTALNPGSDYNVGTSRINEGLIGGSGIYRNPQTGQELNFTTPGSLAELQHETDTTLGRAGTTKDRTLADLLTGKNRGTEDLQTRLRFGHEDRDTALDNLRRQYSRLGVSQGGATRAAGVGGGGTALAAALARKENQHHDREPIETTFNRLQQGVNTSQNRLNEDYTTNTGRTTDDWRTLVSDVGYQSDLSKNKLIGQAAQGQQNLDTSLSQAQGQNTLFNQQLGEAKVGSAQQMGTLPVLPGPDFTQTPGQRRIGIVNQANRPASTALAAAYYKRLGLPVPR